jgi:hypothetical protein
LSSKDHALEVVLFLSFLPILLFDFSLSFCVPFSSWFPWSSPLLLGFPDLANILAVFPLPPVL